MAPVHQLHALLHEDILRFMARCQHEMETHAAVHEAAISKVKSIVTLLWPRAQVAPYIFPALIYISMHTGSALHVRCNPRLGRNTSTILPPLTTFGRHYHPTKRAALSTAVTTTWLVTTL